MTDWIMIVITAVYVIATIFICIFNAKSANAAKVQTQEMKNQFASTYRPKIDIRFEIIRSGLMCFIIENVGTEPAIDVKINLCQEFIDNIGDATDKQKFQELNSSVLYIASNQKITLLIGSQIEFDKISSAPSKFNIQYNGIYNEMIDIDIKQYGFMIIYNSPIEDIRQQLKEIKENEKKFQKDLLKQNANLARVPLNVLTRTATSDDECKFKVYKAVCKLKQANLTSISDEVGFSREDTAKYLNELYTVDKLVRTTQVSKEEFIWHRNV